MWTHVTTTLFSRGPSRLLYSHSDSLLRTIVQLDLIGRNVRRRASLWSFSTVKKADGEDGDVVSATGTSISRESGLESYEVVVDGAVRRPRNKGLASVIREGLGLLNQSASLIQASKQTRRPLFEAAIGWEKVRDPHLRRPSDRQRYESNRILNIATSCLEEMTRKDPCLTVQGEPILLIEVRVAPSLQVATLYWALPYHILLDESLSASQKNQLVARMQHIVQEVGAAKLQRRIHAQLRDYHPPKLRLEPAPEMLIQQLIQEFQDM